MPLSMISEPRRVEQGGRGAARPDSGAWALLAQARNGLLDAEYSNEPAERYTRAHLAALRGAAAVLAARARPDKPGARRRSRPTNAWKLLARVCPELAEWAAFFAAGSAARVAAEAGLSRYVSSRSADDLVRQTRQFLDLVETTLRAA